MRPDKIPNPYETMQKSKTLCIEYIGATTVNPNKNPISHSTQISPLRISTAKWRLPPPQHVKINTDACFDANSRKGTVGIICRDEKGDVLTVMAKEIFAFSPLMAEALGLREVVSLARSLNISRVIFESDCQTLVEACRGNISRGEIRGIVKDINNMRTEFERSGIT